MALTFIYVALFTLLVCASFVQKASAEKLSLDYHLVTCVPSATCPYPGTSCTIQHTEQPFVNVDVATAPKTVCAAPDKSWCYYTSGNQGYPIRDRCINIRADAPGAQYQNVYYGKLLLFILCFVVVASIRPALSH